jgi:AraC-like DNA-binding protein
MPGGGTRTFVEPDHYEASLREAQIEAVIVPRGKFRARLTWAELHSSQVLRCEEDAPRVAYMRFAPQLAFVMFPTYPGPLPVWRGAQLQPGEIVFHGRGERLHQSTPGSFAWNLTAVDAAPLERYGRALAGKALSPSLEGRILRPSQRNLARLRRLHAQACRLAETKSKMLAHSEVARAMEQDLIHALVSCLTTARARTDGFAVRHHVSIMVRFEEVLAERFGDPPRMAELCKLVGVSERTLRACCTEFLGMSPIRYVLLRRLREVRSALREADPQIGNVTEIAHRFGFAQSGRFAGTYRAIFGEAPSTTLQRTSGTRFNAS